MLVLFEEGDKLQIAYLEYLKYQLNVFHCSELNTDF